MSIHTYSRSVFTAARAGGIHTVLTNLLVFTLLTAGAAWCDSIATVSSPSGQSANDTISWAQLGSDQTALQASFNVQTALHSTVNVGLTGANSIVSVVCQASPCSWTGAGFTAGDSLLWTSDAANGGTGPLTLTFASGISGAGAYVQSDALGGFTAVATAYNGSTALGSASIVSQGSAVYVGLLDTTGPNVTSVVFSLSSCSNGCTPADFAIDTVQLSLPPATASVSPGSLSFGSVTIGSSTAKAVTLTNTGGLPLTISSIVTSGDYTQSNNCGSSLGAGAQCSINVTFTPSTTGTRSGSLTITDNSSTGGTQTVSLTGTGANGPTPALQFVPITPCRVVDTRTTNQPELSAGSTRAFTMGGACGIPTTAAAYSLNFTVVPNASLGYITVWPQGQPQPTVSTLNSLDGRVKANAAIVPAGTGGAIDVYASDATQVIIDTNGYFIAAGTSGALSFYPITPCRIVDTRAAAGFGGQFGPPSMTASSTRSFPINPKSGTSDSCSSTIPSTALAYSLNFTAIPTGSSLFYITVWPTGGTQPNVSTLNDLTGTIVANAAIVPGTGTNGSVSVYASDGTDLLIDIDGYFAAPGSGGLSLYTLTPCRVLDTRNNGGSPFSGQTVVNVAGSSCGVPSTAQGYVFNATVVPSGDLLYLSLWPNGQSQPNVSTLNANDGAVTSNMAIVPTTNGLIDAFAPTPTQLILDISSYFAP